MPKLLRDLDNMRRKAEEHLRSMVRDRDALALSTSWVPIVDAAVVTAGNLVESLPENLNIDIMVKTLEYINEKGMPDRVLGSARELVVALLLAGQVEPGAAIGVGGDERLELEELLRECALRGGDERRRV